MPFTRSMPRVNRFRCELRVDLVSPAFTTPDIVADKLYDVIVADDFCRHFVNSSVPCALCFEYTFWRYANLHTL